jgi:uncharacterized protein (TIGR02265 family)
MRMEEQPLANPPPPGLIGSDEELRWRLGLIEAHNQHSGDVLHSRGVVFNSVLEVVRQLGDEHAVERCLQAAGEPRFMDFFNYPYSSLVKMTYAAGWVLSDRYGGFDKALWRMGSQAASSFYSSAAGRAVLMLGQGGPTRMIDTIVNAFQMVVKGAEVSTLLTGPKSAILIYKRDFLPRPYLEAGLVSTFTAAKVKGMKVNVRPTGPLDTEYDLSWE